LPFKCSGPKKLTQQYLNQTTALHIINEISLILLTSLISKSIW
jgi:hypothetical protein